MLAEALLRSLTHAGVAAFRAPAPGDAIDGVLPGLVVQPATAEEVAAVLAWASEERLAVVIAGGGTKLGWGRRPSRVDLVVTTHRLNRVVAHESADLTATVQAGARLADVNDALAPLGQRLPLESAFPEATIGGILATNESGPLRQRDGTPRDGIIGVRLATADGRLVKAGGNVVKNVAGYDLGRLVCGSFGSLAAIVSATFKLAPRWRTSGTLIVQAESLERAGAAVQAVAASQLEPVAFDVSATCEAGRAQCQLFLRFASTLSTVERPLRQATTLMSSCASEVVTGPAESAVWAARREGAWRLPGLVVQASWLPARLTEVLQLVADLCQGCAVIALSGRAGLGSGLLRIEGDGPVQLAVVESLRARPDVVRHVSVLRADPDVKARLEVWDIRPDVAALGLSIKRALDPAGVLNAGRGPV